VISLVEVAEFGGRREEIRDVSEASDRDRLQEAFRVWRKLTGGRARGNFGCCGSCASAELAGMDEGDRSFVFWHRQDDEAFAPDPWHGTHTDTLHSSLWIKHSASAEELELLVELAEAVGLQASWDGSESRCVEVSRQD
jgi:hypothetical protein